MGSSMKKGTLRKTTKKRQPTFVEVGKKQVDKLAHSSMFEAPNLTGPEPNKARRFFIFKQVGQEIEGVLGECIVNFRRNGSYPIVTRDDGTWEIFANKIDHQIIKDNELVGSYVLVRYIGQQIVPHCSRKRKVKRWYKADGLDMIIQNTARIQHHQRPGRKK